MGKRNDQPTGAKAARPWTAEVPKSLMGSAAPSSIWNGYMGGAIRSGRRAADEILHAF